MMMLQEKLERLEAVLINAFRHHQEEQRQHQTFLGLIPGEPIAGEQLERKEIDEPLAV